MITENASANLKTWQSKDIIEEYRQLGDLQAPEKTLLKLLGNYTHIKLLDIGVGGGRTTAHFAKAVEEYWGIDYSAEMIAACRERFRESSNGLCFAVCDARAMNICPDRYFSCVVFSFNGIDYMPHEDRLRVFKEVQRVGKSGGLFFFSSHNLQGLHHFSLRAQLGSGVPTVRKNIQRWLLLRFYYNKFWRLKKLRQSPYALINDGVHENRLLTYYVRPSEQLKQLKPFFMNTQVYRLSSGDVVSDPRELDHLVDEWLYYLCTIP
jgi:ubiquinone/menaquinone biosynthesis C-methylase UbiE